MKKQKSKKSNRRQLSGVVVSNQMEKTVVVKVTRLLLHPAYRKYMHASKQYKAHVSKPLEVGEKVTIEEISPKSKGKSWKVVTNKA